MAEIIISEFMDDIEVAGLSRDFDVFYDPGLVGEPERLASLMGPCRGLIVRNRTMVTAALMDAAPGLAVIGRLGVGLDNIDLDAAAARGVKVCPAVGANAASVAEYALLAMLHLLRPVVMATPAMLAGTFPRGELSGGSEIGGKVLGLIGGGMIGAALAGRARALGLDVVITDPGLTVATTPEGCRLVSLETLLETADVISLHVPLNKHTRGMVDAAMLARMKPGVVLINTARGGIVDHAALATGLRNGHVGGAAIDVFEEEPASKESLAMFDGVENLVLTPHIAGLTMESNARVAAMTAAQVRTVLET
ncbi:MAG: NAD(P)-dependent oxidoreductase [Candidatus Puniceispirillales bacterium]